MMWAPVRTPVLDIGGSHVTAAVVEGDQVVLEHREPLDAAADAAAIFERINQAAAKMHLRETSRWGVAIPGPFNYVAGIGDFVGVNKFHALRGVDVRAALMQSLPAAGDVVFLNDAEAYALGEWQAHDQPHRMICITLGTGVGSGFVVAGSIVPSGSDVPPHGNIHTLTWNGSPLEQSVSTSAIRAAYAARTGENVDVRSIAERARGGELPATRTLDAAMEILGAVLAPWVGRFAPDVLVIGGAMAQSWDVLCEPFTDALSARGRSSLHITAALLADHAPLVGAAVHARATSLPSISEGVSP